MAAGDATARSNPGRGDSAVPALSLRFGGPLVLSAPAALLDLPFPISTRPGRAVSFAQGRLFWPGWRQRKTPPRLGFPLGDVPQIPPPRLWIAAGERIPRLELRVR